MMTIVQDDEVINCQLEWIYAPWKKEEDENLLKNDNESTDDFINDIGMWNKGIFMAYSMNFLWMKFLYGFIILYYMLHAFWCCLTESFTWNCEWKKIDFFGKGTRMGWFMSCVMRFSESEALLWQKSHSWIWNLTARNENWTFFSQEQWVTLKKFWMELTLNWK